MSTILLLLDAFRHDYLTEETTPFLWKCSQTGEYFRRIEQSWGFCERSEILTGLRGHETGFFNAIGFNPDNSPYSKETYLPYLQLLEDTALLALTPTPRSFRSIVQKQLRYMVSACFKIRKINMPIFVIPFSLLPYFALSEDHIDHRDPAAFPKPSILALLEQLGRTYLYDTFTALNFRSNYRKDAERLEAVVRDARYLARDLYLVYIGGLDSCGHLNGPDSEEISEVLRILDKELEQFVRNLEIILPGNRYVFLGDHGMTAVTKRFDAEKHIYHLLNASRLQQGRDVVYFLDSTMVRLWEMSDKARVLLPDLLHTLKTFNENGMWVNDRFARSENIPWPDRRYGDHLWIANPGVLVFPDFFHRYVPPKGMHGYDPKLPESHGVCVHWGHNVKSSEYPIMPLAHVFELLKRNLEL